MNKTKSLTKTFLVAIFAFAMMFAGVSFVMPQRTTAVYAAGASTAFNEDITISFEDFKYGLAKTNLNIQITSSNSSKLSVDGYAFRYTSSLTSQPNKVDSITLPGYYLLDIKIKINQNDYYFGRNSEIYTGNVSLPNSSSAFLVEANPCKSFDLDEVLFDVTEDDDEDCIYLAISYYMQLTGYTVSYDDNVEDTSVSNMPTADTNTYLENAPVTVSTTTPERSGYTFDGWNTKNDGTGTTYQANETFAMGTENVTLYAKWTAITQTHNSITFNPLTSEFTGETLTSNSYYLFSDITLTSAITIVSGASVNLCLNNNTLNLCGKNIQIQEGSTLNIYDCGSNGQITGGSAINGGAIYNNGTLNIDGGTITGNSADYGGAIYNASKGKITIKNCNITGNTATKNGGGIYACTQTVDCFAEGTLITMANGTTKKVENIVEGDIVRTFDHETGLISSKQVCLAYKGDEKEYSFTLNFEHNKSIDIVDCHDLFEQSLMKYVTIRSANANDFVGKYFYNANDNTWEQLLSVTYNNSKCDFYSIYTAHHLNCIANDMLTVADDVDYLLNIFEFDENLKLNQEQKQADIEQYGLLPYSEASEYMSEEYFDNFNTKYLSIAIGKGLTTYEKALQLCLDTKDYLNKKTQNFTPKMALLGAPLITLGSENESPITITLGTNAVISNNTVSSNVNNVYLCKNCFIAVANGATEFSAGVTLENTTGTFVAGAVNSTDLSKFSSDNSSYYTKYREVSGTPTTYNYNIEAKYSVTYNLNDGTGTTPTNTNLYFKDDVFVTALQGNITRTGYKFIGWSDGTNTYTAGANYTVGTSDVILTAVWEEKQTVSITETAQTYTYGDSDIKFAISGTPNSGFSVKYFVGGEWKNETPTNAGSYNVKIAREEDETYKSYSEKIITNGLVINKATPVITLVANDAENLRYDKSIKTLLKTASTTGGTLEMGFSFVSTDEPSNYATTPPVATEAKTYYIWCKVVGDDNYNDVPASYKFSVTIIQTYTITYDGNNNTDGTVPTDSKRYAENENITILGNTGELVRNNYKFVGWNTQQDGSGATIYTANDNYIVGTSDVVLYAKWQKIISEEPNSDNGYTVYVDDGLTVVSYQWYESSIINLTGDFFQESTKNPYLFIWTGMNKGTNKVGTFGFGGPPRIEIKTINSTTKSIIRFTCDNGNNFISGATLKEDYYEVEFNGVETKTFLFNAETTITITEFIVVNGSEISGETSAQLVLEEPKNVNYYCVLTLTTGETAISTEISPLEINFDGNDATSGSAPTTLYQLEGRSITLPANTFTRAGYKFLGWNTEEDSLVASNISGDEFTVNKNAVTLYAIWQQVHICDGIEYNIILNDYVNSNNIIGTGNYFLTSNLTIDKKVFTIMNSNVKICLNGYTLSVSANITEEKYIVVSAGSTLTITDCASNTTHGAIKCEKPEGIAIACLFMINDGNTNDTVVNIKNANILVDNEVFLRLDVGSKNVKSTLENCNITVKESEFLSCSGSCENGEITFKDCSITATHSDTSGYSILLHNEENTKEYTYNFINTSFTGTRYGVLYTKNSIVNIDKDTVFTSNILCRPLISAYNSTTIDLKGTIINSCEKIDQDHYDFDEMSLIKLDKSIVNIYGTTTLSCNNAPVIYLSCENDYVSKICVKEQLTNTTPYEIYQGYAEKLVEGEVIFDFNQFNTSKDVNDYFAIGYSRNDSESPFFNYNEEDDIYSITFLIFTQNLDEEHTTVITNNEDATYQWYKATVSKDNPFNGDNICDFDGAELIEDTNYFVATSSEFSANYISKIPNITRVSSYVCKGKYDIKAGTTNVSFEMYVNKVVKVKIYIDLDGAGSQYGYELLSDEDVILEYGSYSNGYWSSYNISEGGLDMALLCVALDTKTGSKYENAIGYTFQIEFTEDTLIGLFEGDMLGYIKDYLTVYSLEEGYKFYVTYDYVSIDSIINGATSDTVPSSQPGSYVCKATLNGKSIYSNPYIIDKFDISITETAQEGTYNGEMQSFEIKGTDKNIGSFVIEYYVNSTWTETAPINAGSYNVKITRAEDETYKAYSKEIINGLVINKANASITVDQTAIVKTYGEAVTIPTATANFGQVSCDKVASDLVNVGSYTITYTVAGTDNYNGDTKTVSVTINKLAVNEPTIVGTYKYTGNAQTVILNGKESYMTTTDSLTQTDVGIYTIYFTLDNNHEWATGSDGVSAWEIRAIQLVPEGQQGNNNVIVETEDGFSSDIAVVVEVTVETEIEQKELSVDYYNLEDEAKLSNNEKVGIVFDVKLIQTIGGVSQEIQPSDIKAGTKIKVKMLIPETVDISKVTRILHVHSAGDIEEIEFDASQVDENRYYEIEIDRLSEFAFIYQTGNQSNTLMICVLGGLGSLLIALLLVLFLTKRKVIVIANEKVVKEFKFRPLQTIEFKGEINDLDLFTDRELTNNFSQQKMGFKSVVIYGKDVKPKVAKTTTKKATTPKTTETKKVSKTTKK